MTIALCLNCGSTKFGALCACSMCQDPGTGNHELDIAFSDHYVAASTLTQLGRVIQLINSTDEQDAGVKRWVFLRFVTENCKEILSAEAPPEMGERVDALYKSLEFPKVEWKSGIRKA